MSSLLSLPLNLEVWAAQLWQRVSLAPRTSLCSSSQGELGIPPSFRSIGNIDLEGEQSTRQKVESGLQGWRKCWFKPPGRELKRTCFT